MRTKKLFLGIYITALILTVVLISISAYYVAIALFAGTLLIGHREFWSLITKRRLPPFDERVRENISKSIRNGFIFFVLASAFLMLPFSVFLLETPDTVHVLGGLFVSAGTIYLLSYIFYDRVEPKLDKKGLGILKIFLLLTGISVAAFIISVFLHNAIYGLFIHWFGEDFWGKIGIADEPVFFFIAIFIAPLGFAVGIIGSLVIFLKGLFTKAL